MQMSSYPIWWEQPITIFNKHTNPTTQLVKWYKTQIENCFWKSTDNLISVGDRVLETNKIICRIPQSPIFKENFEWLSLPDDVKENYFTVNAGDIVIRGLVGDEIDEYISGKRSSDIIGKYKALQGCMEIETFQINTGTGKNNPHYLVKGV